MTADIDRTVSRWWNDINQVALFGTDRREPPPFPDALPSRPDGDPESAVLDAAALGAALLRAGGQRLPPTDPDFLPAADDERPAPNARARQLLELIMTQSPAGQRLQLRLLWSWLSAAASSGHRIPHRWLPDVLDRLRREPSITGDPDSVIMIRTVADERGRWLSTLDPDWSWLRQDADASPIEPGTWLRQPTPQRVATLRRLRTEDPALARELISSALPTDGAQDRATLLGCLEIGLGSEDESLLEQGLDDRSGVVREVVTELLNGLDDSARAGRMATRLRSLISKQGLISKKLTVQLPHDPDPAGVRDGLGKPPTRRSERGYWLERMAAGAPLAVWTEVSGRDPAPTWAMITDQDARNGIITAVLARRDRQWAEALSADRDGLQSRPEAYLRLLQLLPDVWERLATDWLSDLTTPAPVARLIRGVPTPWGPRFSLTVLNAVDRSNLPIGDLLDQLAAGLHPSSLDRLGELATGQGSVAAREGARNLNQYLTLRTEIAEAFR